MDVWDDYNQFRVSPEMTCTIRHHDVLRMLGELRSIRPESIQISEFGESYEGRKIPIVSVGTGPCKVLAWSQMHGNEPTHTAALLDLISLLISFPSDPIVESILSNCTLSMILMLNPDGAERYTRRNAQGIDINRDALELQTPEGRLLRKAVEELKPQFALNLHNQSPRTAVGDNPPRVAAFSLLVPPIDEADTQTETVIHAKQLAACILRAVDPHCAGMISRYDADFMPRCFGEWVQQQGVATLTLEAGGWTTASIEGSPLVRLHLLGLVDVLEAIAKKTYLDADSRNYDALPRSNEHPLLDVVLQNAVLVGRDSVRSYHANLGINFAKLDSDNPRCGKIVEFGDLSVTTGKRVLDCSNLWCLPGRIAFCNEVTPNSLPDEKGIRELLQEGVTSVVGRIDLSNAEELTALQELRSSTSLPLNLGFVADLATCQESSLVARAVHAGLLGVIAESIPVELSDLIDCLSLAQVERASFCTTLQRPSKVREYLSTTEDLAALLKLPELSQICAGNHADIVCLRQEDQEGLDSSIDWSGLQRVLVAGNVVLDGQSTSTNHAGRLLKNRFDQETI